MSPQSQLALEQFRDGRYQEAERTALQCPPDDPGRCVALGMVYLHTQREAEALACLESNPDATVATLLGEHLAARKAMAAKLSRQDPEGERMAAKFQALGYSLPKQGVRLSACLIVKDEATTIEACLKSLKGVADEIVVVDTGSTDDTIARAKKHGAKVNQTEWTDDFSAARNVSLQHATGDWALWIDADETLDPGSVSAIHEALMRPQFGGFFVRIVNYLADTGQAAQYVHRPIRLFRLADGVKFVGRIHEQVSPSIQATGRPCANLDGVVLHHSGYRPQAMRDKNKLERTISMLEREVAERPEDGFQWFNLANVLSVAGRYAEAEHASVQASRNFPPKASFVAPAYHLMAVSRIELGRPQDALQACDEVERLGLHNVVNQFNRAHALMRLRRFEEALAAVRACDGMEWNPDIPGDYGIVTHKKHVLEGQILAQSGRLDEALAAFDAALAVDPDYDVVLYSKAATLEQKGQTAEALAAYDQVIGSEALDLPARKGAMRMRIAQNEFDQAVTIGRDTWVRYMDEDAWLLWAGAAEQADDPVALDACYEAYAQANTPTPQMWVNWGRVHEALDKPQSAYDCYAEAMKAAPQDPNACFNAADLLYRLGMHHEAAVLYQSGLQLDAMKPEGWFCLGNCLAQLGLADGARLAYGKTLELDPQHAGAQHNLSLFDASQPKAA